MIVVTHEISFARDVADRVIYMEGGVIVEQGKPKEVIENPKDERNAEIPAVTSQRTYGLQHLRIAGAACSGAISPGIGVVI